MTYKELAKIVNKKPSTVAMFFSRHRLSIKSNSDLIPMLQKGHIDIIMADMSKTFARSKAIDFSDAYFKTGFSIMINKVQAGKDHIPMNLSYHKFKGGIFWFYQD
jgi:ABC-type amino acid transport/signal transduction systems, periplasmic component/domain